MKHSATMRAIGAKGFMEQEGDTAKSHKAIEEHLVKYYGIEEIGAKLNQNQPFFWMSDGAMYAIETRKVTEKNKETGQMETKDVPTNFRRLDKNRQLKGRQRIIARKLDNKFQKSMEAKQNEFSKGFASTAAGQVSGDTELSTGAPQPQA